jgi:hypothetical protein
MTTRAAGRAARARGEGFVLIGVVIFVLALTIIGISLFSLSSYEAQFLQHSLDGERAFQSAVGGVERAKFVLEQWGSRFEDVKQDAPPGTWAVAWDIEGGLIDSTNGTVDWDTGNPVFIRVVAGDGADRRVVEAWFLPVSVQNYYRQLITTGGGIKVRTVGIYPETDRTGTVTLDGPIWETSGQPISDWREWLGHPWPSLAEIQTTPRVPVPDVREFIAARANGTQPVIVHLGDPIDPYSTYISRLTLTGGTSQPLYTTSDDPGNRTWSFYEGVSIDLNEVRVSGCAVWLFPRGVRFFQPVQIEGTGPPGADCLVIVAGQNGPTPNTDYDEYELADAGIWFNGGLQSNIPVVLVSDGKVVIWHDNNYTGGSTADSWAGDISIFAGAVSLMGPELASTHTVQLGHVEHGTGTLNEHFLPMLLSNGALPSLTSASGRRLALQPGTWRASTP